MTQKPKFQRRLSLTARSQILEILEWTGEQFGKSARKRYRKLVEQAVVDLENDPYRLGTRIRTDLTIGCYSYHIRFSKSNISPPFVKSPRHLFIYQIQDQTIIILGVFHDSMDVENQFSEEADLP